MVRFIGKKIRKKVVRPLKNSVKYGNYNEFVNCSKNKDNEKEKSRIDNVITENNDSVKEQKIKKENKKQKKEKDMVRENKLTQMETLVGTTIPQMSVKVEKGDKGLYERTENSTILLTEDNKMLLND